jgi:hypothetical protein
MKKVVISNITVFAIIQLNITVNGKISYERTSLPQNVTGICKFGS